MAKIALRSNRKFKRLLAMVRVDSPEHLRGHLSALWETTWENGTPLIGDLQDIEAAAGWSMTDVDKYPPGAFAAALVLARLVDVVVEGELYAVHDWYDHAPEWVKKRVGRAAKEDATVGPKTYFLGLDVWLRRCEELGITVDLSAEEEAADTPDCQEVSLRRPKPSSSSETAAETAQFLENGRLSSLAKASLVKPSHGTNSPPRSPSPLFSTGRASADELQAATGRVTDAVVALMATGREVDETAAEQLEDAALACRTLTDWTALADLAAEAVGDLAHFAARRPA